ncbi:small G protein signaling modulator 2-like isoform X2 [Phlebotomus papatasi]|uniref:small G protein signaling modulator 2-like isoform X2 n=1 Tax=Phlebotomus papatasi TaxID=29031 RepID=UPI0024839E3E|nr:small G protein signaling modulator 2-like isoform X2 [Phlebotomus papatasi]
MEKVAGKVLNMSGQTDSNDYKERLIASVKREVKQVMEEAVTRKFIHEESGSVTSLCASVEACLSQGLRRRALGLFKTSSTTALLHKVAKHCNEAAYISKKVLEIEHADPNKRSSSSGDSTSKPPILKKNSSNSVSTTTPPATVQPTVKYLWIRLALYEKKLSRIIDHLVTNAPRYYERDSLVADPDYGSILSSLLVGPCALEYSRTKTADHFWTDPPADELVQRHRISSSHPTPPSCRRPILNFKRSLHTSSEDGSSSSFKSTASATVAKDYVESLHQNSRATLLYGKNNVLVLPYQFESLQKDVKDEPMPGYLSLHQTAYSLTIKWTPNQLMNGYTESEAVDKSSFWAYALNINVDDIVYVHCHQARGTDTGGTIILVGQDGVQRPPIHFPEGGHMASFLSCLETGLLPHGQLDPPLWSQRGIGKVFPLLSRGRRRPLPSLLEAATSGEETPIDYVFRVVNKSNHEEFQLVPSLLSVATHSILDIGRTSPRRHQLSSCSTNESSDCSSKSMSIDSTNPAPDTSPQGKSQTASIALVCSTMRRQIISRAFYGWLAYCRHLSTVRTHLSGLVNGRITPDVGTEEGLTKSVWEEMNADGVVSDDTEVYRLVYFGGVEHSIRKEVWPYLLGHYSFGSTVEERAELDQSTHNYYETTMSEWLAVEAIVRQRDKEKTAHAVAKLSSESGSGDKTKGVHLDGEMENDVFEENVYSDISDVEGFDDNDANHIKELPLDPKNPTSPSDTEPQPEDEEKKVMQLEVGGESAGGSNKSSPTASSYETVGAEFIEFSDPNLSKLQSPSTDKEEEEDTVCGETSAHVIVTNASIDVANLPEGLAEKEKTSDPMSPLPEETGQNSLDALQEPKSACVSPASSNGGIYSSELLELFGLNLHRIEKDVNRCDRNYYFFANENIGNLDKLRNVICTYVWEHLDVGYMQGMCDLLAPILVILDDESLSYGCFCRLMERMIENFPNGDAMDMHFANMRSLIQILDSEMYDLMHAHGDYTHFYFCYRWFLLDFKRELVYADVFATWEAIWAAKHVASGHFVLFLALALLETYRDIIIVNSMDFTDVIKFFNEMAERHNASEVLKLARSLVLQLQTIIEN